VLSVEFLVGWIGDS